MMDAQLIERLEQRVRQLGFPVGVTLWDGRSVIPAAERPRVTVNVRSPKALAVLADPTLGRLARSYVEQELDVEGASRDIVRLSELLCEADRAVRRDSRHLGQWVQHTRLFDRKAIHRHYDVSDDFFGLWLDRRRVYSCAYFRREDDTLDIAQEQKLDHICRKLRLAAGERFLDIGCGWGALILWAAQHYGARALGVTLSRNQHDYVCERIKALGLEARCAVRLLDYRDIPEAEPFDKIASVGMVEHVGHGNLPVYFGKIFRLLKPGGLVMNHGITLNIPKRQELGSGLSEFIDEYVFPGGELAHISQVIAEMSAQRLECWDVESLRPHYARTLWSWVERLEANREAALAIVGEKIFRIWRIYMAGSAHAFESGWVSVYQVLAGRRFANGTFALPATRDDIYAR